MAYKALCDQTCVGLRSQAKHLRMSFLMTFFKVGFSFNFPIPQYQFIYFILIISNHLFLCCLSSPLDYKVHQEESLSHSSQTQIFFFVLVKSLIIELCYCGDIWGQPNFCFLVHDLFFSASAPQECLYSWTSTLRSGIRLSYRAVCISMSWKAVCSFSL